jgi:hypothetical protein
MKKNGLASHTAKVRAAIATVAIRRLEVWVIKVLVTVVLRIELDTLYTE